MKFQNLGGLKNEQLCGRMCGKREQVKNYELSNKNISISGAKMIKYNLLFDALYLFASP
jgi:hypothetical protein